MKDRYEAQQQDFTRKLLEFVIEKKALEERLGRVNDSIFILSDLIQQVEIELLTLRLSEEAKKDG